MPNEFYNVAFRKKVYYNIEELQKDLDAWVKSYNEERPHSGARCYGKTPLQTFEDSKELAISKQLDLIKQTVMPEEVIAEIVE